MRILLTGGTGLIGSKLGQLLASEGHRVVVLSRNPAQAGRRCAFPAEHYSWDALGHIAASKIDAVVHLAGESVFSGLWTASRKQKILSSRVESTKQLIQSFQKANQWPDVWINGSAIGYYGDAGDQVLDEGSSLGKGFLADVCHAWENTLSEVPSRTRVVRLRTGLVLSTQGGALRTMLPGFRLGLAGILGSGKQWMSWIHIEDLRHMILWCLSGSIAGAVNGVAPHPVTNYEFTKTLGRILQRPTVLAVPALAIKGLGEMSSLFLESQRVEPKAAMTHGFIFKYQRLSEALGQLLDFQSRRGVHEFLQEQWIPQKIEDVFPYFCDEKNLEAMTPGILEFKVLGKSTPQIQEGTLIDYKLKIRGVPARWRTKILEWQPGERFVDTQLRGPYKLWHHTHEFVPMGDGVLMRDRVLYKMPLWPLGESALPIVQGDIETIFSHRRAVVARTFGSSTLNTVSDDAVS